MLNHEILNYIKILSNNEDSEDLLIKTVGKILSKQDNIENYIKNNKEKITHIRDWIFSIVESQEEWKTPRVLTIEALNNSANKYFQKKNNKFQMLELTEEEKIIVNLNDYYVVQMLTPDALDIESKQMQHCIGHGGYDKKVKDPDYQYLSLRDKFNKAHVTLEIKNNEILQLQGKQNNIPDEKYLNIILPWLMNNNYKNIPWYKIKKFYENGRMIDFKDISLKKDIDYEIINFNNEISLLKMLNDRTEVYFRYCFCDQYFKNISYFDENDHIINKKQKDIFFIDQNNIFQDLLKILDKQKDEDEFYVSRKKNNIKKEYLVLFDYIKDICRIDLNQFDLILNKNDNNIYSIYNIPDNCEVDGNLSISSFSLEKLPNNLTVNGNLDLVDNNLLKKLPNGLTVNGNLYLSYGYFDSIPNDLKLSGNLILNYANNISELPNNFTINGNLDISNCDNLIELPENLVVKGSLILKEMMIQKFPNSIKVEKTLYIKSSDVYFEKGIIINDFKVEGQNFKKFPNNIRVEKNISLNNVSIKKLPDNLTVNGNLYLTNCMDLESLSENLNVKGHLYLTNCKKLEELFGNIFIEGNFDINNCMNLIKLPNGLIVNGYLALSKTNISELPQDIKVNNLYLINSEIKFLPENLVLNNLNVRGSKLIEKLPDNITILNYFSCADSGIKNLPNNIKNNNNLSIYIRGTKIDNIPECIQYNQINIDTGQINLMKNNLNFKTVLLSDYSKKPSKNTTTGLYEEEYTKEEFFKKFVFC